MTETDPATEADCTMTVFIGWSGETSNRVAQTLYDYLSTVSRWLRPWMSEVDLGPGASWFHEIVAQLRRSDYGILCMTAENLDSYWLHYEAGAFVRHSRPRLIPLLFRVSPRRVAGPLRELQCVDVSEAGLRRLLSSLSSACREVCLGAEEIDLDSAARLKANLDNLADPAGALGPLIDGRHCWIICPTHRLTNIGSEPLGPNHWTEAVTFAEHQGIAQFSTMLQRYVDAALIHIVPGALRDSAATGLVLIGGDRVNDTTAQILTNESSPIVFSRAPELNTDWTAEQPWSIRSRGRRRPWTRNLQERKDHGLIVKLELGDVVYLVLAGLGARSTWAACRYLVEHLGDPDFQHASFACLISVVLTDNLPPVGTKELCWVKTASSSPWKKAPQPNG